MPLSRRSVLLGSAALGMMALRGSPGLAQVALAPGRFSSVAVDVGPLRARGLGDYAEFVRQALLAALQSAFADRLGGPGPPLVVRVTGLSLNSYAGSGQGTSGRGRSLGGGTDNDYLDGEALIVGPRGAVLARVMAPQVLRLALPGLGNVWQMVVKESALISVTGLVELMRQTGIAANSTRLPFLFYGAAGALYLLITTVSGALFDAAERRAGRGMARRAA